MILLYLFDRTEETSFFFFYLPPCYSLPTPLLPPCYDIPHKQVKFALYCDFTWKFHNFPVSLHRNRNIMGL